MPGWVAGLLLLLFVDEVLAVAAIGVGGHELAGVAGATVGVLLAVVLWALFAAPKAHRGAPLARPVVKVLVFGAATVGLWVAGHPAWAVAFLAVSAVVNGLAELPAVRAHHPRTR